MIDLVEATGLLFIGSAFIVTGLAIFVIYYFNAEIQTLRQRVLRLEVRLENELRKERK